MMRYPMLQRIRECSAEVAVMRGERDPIARERWCRRLVAASGGPAELVTVPREHHVIPRTATEAVTRELVRLAERVERRLADVAGRP
jgi:dipeptidyl aminopeptidase/acylaminoacyl peptidase